MFNWQLAIWHKYLISKILKPFVDKTRFNVYDYVCQREFLYHSLNAMLIRDTRHSSCGVIFDPIGFLINYLHTTYMCKMLMYMAVLSS
jgi:hypothetical protein